MKTTLIAVLVMTGATLTIGSAIADSSIKSRSGDDAYNDMMRNYYAPASGEPTKQVMTRSEEAAHADLMRDWDATMTGQPQKATLSQSEHDRYMELMRGTFPLSHMQE